MNTHNNSRIEWIDVVKGIAILLMIVGHTKCPEPLSRVIFSFHMPLFFILSGLTFSPAKEWKSLPRKTWQSFRGLILPIIAVMSLQRAYNMIVSHTFSMSNYWNSLKVMFSTSLYWASGAVKDNISVIGVFWFVFSLFWGKLIVNLFCLLFGKKNVPFLCTATAVWAIYLGEGIYLPQNMDVTLVAVLFIAAGMSAREHMDWIRNHKMLLFVVCVALWGYGMGQSAVIQMAKRSYPGGLLSVFTALAGSFMVCCMGEALSDNAVCRKALAYVGRHTLLMLILHHLFWSYSYLWDASTALRSQVKRVTLNLLLTSAIVLIQIGLHWIWRKCTHKHTQV